MGRLARSSVAQLVLKSTRCKDDGVLPMKEDMKVVILAGGLGTRLAEETDVKPKPMVEIGGHPLFWHIMRHYGHFGFEDFVIALGYQGEIIKKYIVHYFSLQSDLTGKNGKRGSILGNG